MVHKVFPEDRKNHTRRNRRIRYLFTYAYRCYSAVKVTCWEGEYFVDVDSGVSTNTTFRDVE